VRTEVKVRTRRAQGLKNKDKRIKAQGSGSRAQRYKDKRTK
jgi:hypothetical protein